MIRPRRERVFLPSVWARIASACPARPAATAIDSSSQPSVQCHQRISRDVRRPMPLNAHHSVVITYCGARMPWNAVACQCRAAW